MRKININQCQGFQMFPIDLCMNCGNPAKYIMIRKDFWAWNEKMAFLCEDCRLKWYKGEVVL